MRESLSERSSLDRCGLIEEKPKYTSDEEAEQFVSRGSISSLRNKSHHVIFYISVLFNVILTVTGAIFCITFSASTPSPVPFSPISHNTPSAQFAPQDVYSPAESAIEYQTVVFRTGFLNDWTEYQGSSSAVNQAWEDLYNEFGISQVDADTASRLPNATTPLNFDNSAYVIQLDVFHQLHCLNMLRKRLYPEVYPIADMDDETYHLEHCVESLRQSLMCAGDVSTIYWEWSRAKNKMMGNTATTHVCRDFEKIKEWALEHKITADPDWLQYVDGAPLRDDSKGDAVPGAGVSAHRMTSSQ